MLEKYKPKNVKDSEELKAKKREYLRDYALKPSLFIGKDIGMCSYTGLPFIVDDLVTIEDCGYTAYTEYVREHKQEFVVYEDKLYLNRNDYVVPTLDTLRKIPRSKAIATRKGFYEQPNDNILFDKMYGWFEKDETIIAKDTGNIIPKSHAYSTGDAWYQFSSLADRGGSPLRFSHVQFPTEITERMIGVEFEFGDATKTSREVLRDNHFRSKWQSVRDGSLDGISNAIEFVSVPLKITELDEVVKFMEFAQKTGSNVYDACGFHVHVGAQDIGFMDIASLIALCTKIEDELFNMFPENRRNNEFCRKLNSKFSGFLEVVKREDKKKAGERLYSDQSASFKDRHRQSKYVDSGGHRGIRYQWLNIDRIYHKRQTPNEKTIEFRIHEATTDIERFINFVLLCYYLVEFAKTHSKQVCVKSTLIDVVSEARYEHRKRLIKYIKQ